MNLNQAVARCMLFLCVSHLACEEEKKDPMQVARQEVAAYAQATASEEDLNLRESRTLCLPAYLNQRICSSFHSSDYIPIALDAMKSLPASERIGLLQAMMSDESWFGILTAASPPELADRIFSMWSDAEAEVMKGGKTRTSGIERILSLGVQGVYVTRAIRSVGEGDANDRRSLISILDALSITVINQPAINLLGWINSEIEANWPSAAREQWLGEAKLKWLNERASDFHKLLYISQAMRAGNFAGCKDIVMRLWQENDHEKNSVRSKLLFPLWRLNEGDFLVSFIEDATARPYSANNEKMLDMAISTLSHYKTINDKSRCILALDKIISRTIDLPEARPFVLLTDEKFIINSFRTRVQARQAREYIARMVQ